MGNEVVIFNLHVIAGIYILMMWLVWRHSLPGLPAPREVKALAAQIITLVVAALVWVGLADPTHPPGHLLCAISPLVLGAIIVGLAVVCGALAVSYTHLTLPTN